MAKFNEYREFGGGDFLKLEKGETKIRVVTEMEEHLSHYVNAERKSYACLWDKCQLCQNATEWEQVEANVKGNKQNPYKPRRQFVGWVIDRRSGKIKLLFAPYSIFKQMGELSESSEYGFADLPPYDLVINKTGEMLETEYKVNAGRQDTPLTTEEKKMVEELKPVKEILDRINKKNGGIEINADEQEQATKDALEGRTAPSGDEGAPKGDDLPF